MIANVRLLAGLAWRNLWRQPHRTWLSVTSIGFACVVTIFVLALQQGSYNTMRESVLRLFDGFAQIQPEGYINDPDIRSTIADPHKLAGLVGRLSSVTASAPRASSFVIASNGPRSYGAAAYGIDPAREARLSVIGRAIVKGRSLKPGDGNVAIVGAGLARNLKLAIGSKLTMLGGGYDGSVAADVLTVIGIFATGAPEIDRHMIEMPLTRFQEAFGLGTRINTMALTGHSLSEFQTGLEDLHHIAAREGLVLRDWTELQPGVYEHILLDASFSTLLYACLIAVVTFIILNSLFMSVLERTREFGMLLALGMRPGQIGAMVWIELAMLTGLGLAGGLAVGTAIAYWLSVEGIVFSGAEQLMAQFNMSSTLYPELNMFSALAGPLAITIAITLAGFVPYRHVRRLEPVTAMRAA